MKYYICSGDAGGGNLLHHYIENQELNAFYNCFGASSNIFKNCDPQKDVSEKPISIIKNFDKVVTTTSHLPEVEKKIRLEAYECNKPVSVVFDNWTNYCNRIHPNEVDKILSIWVFDKWAYELATQYYPKINVVQKENFYVQNQRKIIGKFVNTSKLEVTIILEPIRKKIFNNRKFDELDFLYNTLKSLKEFNLKIDNINIKPHPAHNDHDNSNFVNILRKFKFNYNLTSNRTVGECAKNSFMVCGFESYALYLLDNTDRKIYLPYRNKMRLNLPPLNNEIPSATEINDVL